jgi:hypothetical protein
MPLLPRVGWVASADSEFYPAANALDANLTTFWRSEVATTHWLAVDMGAPRTIDCVRFEASGTSGFEPGPYLVRCYVSDDGITWVHLHTKSILPGGFVTPSRSYEVWPVDKQPHLLHFNQITTRHFKVMMRSPYGRATCREVYAGLLGAGDWYKWYYHAASQAGQGFYPSNPYTLGIISQVGPNFGEIRIWSTRSLAYYPHVQHSNWQWPEGYPIAGITNLCMVLEAGLNPRNGHHNCPHVETGYAIQLGPTYANLHFGVELWPDDEWDIIRRTDIWETGDPASGLTDAMARELRLWVGGALWQDCPLAPNEYSWFNWTNAYWVVVGESVYVPVSGGRSRAFYRKPFFPPR